MDRAGRQDRPQNEGYRISEMGAGGAQAGPLAGSLYGRVLHGEGDPEKSVAEAFLLGSTSEDNFNKRYWTLGAVHYMKPGYMPRSCAEYRQSE